MSIILIEGFKAYSNLDGTKSIIIDSDYIHECMQIYFEYDLHGVAITTSHNYKLQNVDFLSEYTNIKRLSVSDGIKDISAIHKLSNLEDLIISGENIKIDFQFFPNIKKINMQWSSKLINLEKCKSLESLAIYGGYNPKSKDLSDISNIHWLKKLEINSSTITSFEKSENFDRLEKLEFNYCSKLENISGFENSKSTLKSLLFGNCKSIKNHESVAVFDNLNILGFNECGTIKSLKFIKKMKSLNSFRFMRTDVADGDITPCIGLDYVSFTNKKHFTHKMEQLKNNS